MVVGFYGERTKNWFSLHLCTEVHVMRRMFNIDIYVIKCPAKAERKPLVLMLGLGFVLLVVVVVCLTFPFVILSFLAWVGVPGFVSLESRVRRTLYLP